MYRVLGDGEVFGGRGLRARGSGDRLFILIGYIWFRFTGEE